MKKLKLFSCLSAAFIGLVPYAQAINPVKPVKSGTAAKCNLAAIDKVFGLMAQRTSYMQGVAAYKYVHKSSDTVYDAKQEQKVASTALSIAKRYHLKPASLLVFSQIQMDLSKQIEAFYIDSWNTNPATAPDPATVKSLEVLRQKIAKIDSALYPAIAANLQNVRVCSDKQLHDAFETTFKPVAGIPVINQQDAVSYSEALYDAFLQIKTR